MSTDELKAYLSEACTDEKIAEYTEKYNDSYFAEKVLLMNIIEQSAGARPCLYINSLDFGSLLFPLSEARC